MILSGTSNFGSLNMVTPMLGRDDGNGPLQYLGCMAVVWARMALNFTLQHLWRLQYDTLQCFAAFGHVWHFAVPWVLGVTSGTFGTLRYFGRLAVLWALCGTLGMRGGLDASRQFGHVRHSR